MAPRFPGALGGGRPAEEQSPCFSTLLSQEAATGTSQDAVAPTPHSQGRQPQGAEQHCPAHPTLGRSTIPL